MTHETSDKSDPAAPPAWARRCAVIGAVLSSVAFVVLAGAVVLVVVGERSPPPESTMTVNGTEVEGIGGAIKQAGKDVFRSVRERERPDVRVTVTTEPVTTPQTRWGIRAFWLGGPVVVFGSVLGGAAWFARHRRPATYVAIWPFLFLIALVYALSFLPSG